MVACLKFVVRITAPSGRFDDHSFKNEKDLQKFLRENQKLKSLEGYTVERVFS